MPQFTQQVLLYTPTWAGLVLSPGGIAIMVLIPVVNTLVEIVQTRYVIAFGFWSWGWGSYPPVPSSRRMSTSAP
jgi:DHA2 family multidrug resistance protein